MRPEIFLAIQVVDVHHGKAHCGGAGARARAGLPRGLPLPIVGEVGVLHQCLMSGRDGFVPRAQGWARIALQLPASHAQRPPQSIVFGWQSAVHETAAQSGWAPTGAQLLA